MLKTRSEAGAAQWPQEYVNGKMVDLPTNADPTTGLQFCSDCWDGKHRPGGCLSPGCQCKCYRGRVKSKSGIVKPRKDLDTELPDAGAITF